MAQAKFMKLQISDFWKGLLITIGTAIGTALIKYLDSGQFPATWGDWKMILFPALSAGIIYILKNLITNTKGKLLKKEKDD